MENNIPPQWLKHFMISDAYTPTKKDIDDLQAQESVQTLIQKYSCIGETEDDS